MWRSSIMELYTWNLNNLINQHLPNTFHINKEKLILKKIIVILSSTNKDMFFSPFDHLLLLQDSGIAPHSLWFPSEESPHLPSAWKVPLWAEQASITVLLRWSESLPIGMKSVWRASLMCYLSPLTEDRTQPGTVMMSVTSEPSSMGSSSAPINC